MALSKKDLSRKKNNLKVRLASLMEQTKKDPLHRNKKLWDEIALLKKKMGK